MPEEGPVAVVAQEGSPPARERLAAEVRGALVVGDGGDVPRVVDVDVVRLLIFCNLQTKKPSML